MNKLNIFYCPVCGSVALAYGNPAFACCGQTLQPVAVETAQARPDITEMDGEYLLEYNNPMTKDDFIAAVVVERYDHAELYRLFPEQAAQVRIPQVKGAKITTLYRQQGKVWATQF